jgi:hypothetical protein
VAMASPGSATRPEDLSAQYAGQWVIYRDLCPDGTHDEWVAEARDPADGRKITADDIDGLAERLAAKTSQASDAPQLVALRERWSPQWCIWRSRNSDGEPNEWCATHREPNMTLMEPTADALEAALTRHPEPLVIHG